jgi:hypothetical protein
MPLSWIQVAEWVRAELTGEERTGAAVYLDEQELPAGSSVEIDGRKVPVPSRSAMAFVDREPRANWGHACRYLLIDLDTGAVRSLDAQFPPFLRGAPSTLRLIWKGETVPDWALAAR